MDVEQLGELEIIERIAFERGRQQGLALGYDDLDALDDLRDDTGHRWFPMREAFKRGLEYGQRLREMEEREG